MLRGSTAIGPALPVFERLLTGFNREAELVRRDHLLSRVEQDRYLAAINRVLLSLGEARQAPGDCSLPDGRENQVSDVYSSQPKPRLLANGGEFRQEHPGQVS